MNKRKLPSKIVVISLLFCGMITFLGSTTTSASPSRVEPANNTATLSVDDPEATYQGARIVHNVTVRGEKGMRVHAKFTVKYGEDVECMLIAYFYFDDEGSTPLKSANARYRTKTGNVSASTNFTPGYDPAVYNDLQLFVPYDALNMESGDDYDLKFYLALYDKEGGRFFGKSGWYKFHLTMP